MELKTYEGMFMLDPIKAAQEWDNIKKQIFSMLERRKGVIISARKWGERKLAYEIGVHKRAAYLLVYFQMPPENVNTLRRDLQLSEIVMRTLILAQNRDVAKDDPKLDREISDVAPEQNQEPNQANPETSSEEKQNN